MPLSDRATWFIRAKEEGVADMSVSGSMTMALTGW
jgi:hypothetical protein